MLDGSKPCSGAVVVLLNLGICLFEALMWMEFCSRTGELGRFN